MSDPWREDPAVVGEKLTEAFKTLSVSSAQASDSISKLGDAMKHAAAAAGYETGWRNASGAKRLNTDRKQVAMNFDSWSGRRTQDLNDALRCMANRLKDEVRDAMPDCASCAHASIISEKTHAYNTASDRYTMTAKCDAKHGCVNEKVPYLDDLTFVPHDGPLKYEPAHHNAWSLTDEQREALKMAASSALNPVTGDTYVDTRNAKTYIFNGSVWDEYQGVPASDKQITGRKITERDFNSMKPPAVRDPDIPETAVVDAW